MIYVLSLTSSVSNLLASIYDSHSRTSKPQHPSSSLLLTTHLRGTRFTKGSFYFLNRIDSVALMGFYVLFSKGFEMRKG